MNALSPKSFCYEKICSSSSSEILNKILLLSFIGRQVVQKNYYDALMKIKE